MKDKVLETLAGLKDFQQKTVDYVYDQLYVRRRNKMLIADEVGLGKTIVAKGIIAKAWNAFTPSDEKQVFNVVYVCSNQALAKQNLNKLNFTGDDAAVERTENDRLTDLAYEPESVKKDLAFNIKAFTPATSFDNKTNTGKADERVLLYRLLYDYRDLGADRNSLKWILKANQRISPETWDRKISEAEQFDLHRNTSLRKIRSKVFTEFRKILDEERSMDELRKCYKAAELNYPVKHWTLIKRLCQLGLRKNSDHNFDFQSEFISDLRFRLSKVCMEFLKADIFILDEFQRYKQLIEGSIELEDDDKGGSPAMEIARGILTAKDTKILMLSATPFKPFTNEFDELNGEMHYQEFKTVLQFLIPHKSNAFWEEYEKNRRHFFNFLRHPHQLAEKETEAVALKVKLEQLYRQALVRTEKILASNDHNALIKRVREKPVEIQREDIQDFVAMDHLTQLLNKKLGAALPAPLEYVKSSPFALSFLDGYKHKEKARDLAEEESGLRRLLHKTRHAWIDFERIKEYKPLITENGNKPPNAKLRLLLDETVLNGGWKLLWIPPSIPYYELHGAFKDTWGYSKTLIFSSWKMVPRMVASLVSYEAERHSVGDKQSISEKEKTEGNREYFQRRRTPRPQFTFKVEKEAQEPAQMNNFLLTYPGLFLADLYDPAVNIREKKGLQEIRDHVKHKILAKFKELNIEHIGNERGDWNKWYWFAPLLLDQDNPLTKSWISKPMPSSELLMGSETDQEDRQERTGKGQHFEHAREAYLARRVRNLPRLKADQVNLLAEHLTNLALGSPAICFLRSIRRHLALEADAMDAAFHVASAFLTLFNKPESIAIVRLTTFGEDYWQRVIQYMIDGNLQAMLDEFVYLLRTGENLTTADKISGFIAEILTVRTANAEVDDLNLFLANLKRDKPQRKMMRSHYAADFGIQKVGSGTANRQINIRQAFNSPFRPFVLASTSIGQEGLDFHLYCRKIFHWNLPSNPIDFEQREGRIHRYMGLVIRLNLAEKYRDELMLPDSAHDAWKEIITLGSREKNSAPFPSDLIPFWHTEPQGDIKIERYVPLYPFSRDIAKFENLLKILTFYRLTFGQPRQEELIDSFGDNSIDEETMNRLKSMVINLSPIRF